MSDPFETIFGPETAATPRQAFAERLRRQLIGELGDLATPSNQQQTGDFDMTDSAGVDPTLVNHGSLFYYTLPAADVERAARFYSGLFGWQLERGDSGYHVANVYPPMGLASNESTDPEVWIEVSDIEVAVAKVRELGGEAEDPVHYDSGWSAACRDPQGVRFNLSVPRNDYRQPARRSTEVGELFYWSLPAPEASVSKAFYSEVFGWEFGDPGSAGGMHIENRQPDGGLGGGRDGTGAELFFRVVDLDAAVAKVRDLGGTAEVVGGGDEGIHAMCVDDQGVAFGLSQPAEGY